MTAISNQCFLCKNYLGGLQCRAYPQGIPPEIPSGHHDHREPFKDDGGIRFEPARKAKP